MSDPSDTQNRERVLDYLESQIPALSGSATSAAYWQALASGLTVLEADNGTIYEVSADGTRRAVKKIAPPTTLDTSKPTIG